MVKIFFAITVLILGSCVQDSSNQEVAFTLNVSDLKTSEPIKEASIFIRGSNLDTISLKTNSNGISVVPVIESQVTSFSVAKEGYVPFDTIVQTAIADSSRELVAFMSLNVRLLSLDEELNDTDKDSLLNIIDSLKSINDSILRP